MPSISKKNYPWLVYLILSTCLIIPFSNDEYIPALPDIARSLATTHAQWVMSVFFLGIAMTQLFYGPLLDRYGRKPILIIGLSIFTFASFLAVTATSIQMLLIARFIQAMGACSTIVGVLAIVRDAYPPEQIVKMTAFIMGIIAVCPTLAPIIGNFLQILGGWRACFALLLAMGIFYLALIIFFLKETLNEKNHHALHWQHLFFNYLNLLKSRHYLGYGFTTCFSYAALFCYFAVAPFLLFDLLHIPVLWIGLIIAVNALPLLAISYFMAKIFGEFSLTKSLIIGSLFILAGGVLMVGISLITAPSLLGLGVPMFISSIGIGIIRPSASAGAIKLAERKLAGSAAAMYSFFSFLGAAAFTTFTAKLSYHSLLPFAILLTFLGFAASISSLFTRGSEQAKPILIHASPNTLAK